MDATYAAVFALSNAKSKDDLVLIGSRWATIIGFERWAFSIGAPAHPQLIGTYPEQWVNDVMGDGGVSDPLLRMAIKRDTPFHWDLSQKESLPSGMTVKESQLIKERWALGLRSGITVATRSNTTSATCLLSVCTSACSQNHIRPLQEPGVVLFAQYIREAVRRVMGESVMRPATHGLVDREIACIRWAMEGKTNADIGTILEITQATVNFHLGNAAKKLGTSGRMQTFAAALRLGIIDLWNL